MSFQQNQMMRNQQMMALQQQQQHQQQQQQQQQQHQQAGNMLQQQQMMQNQAQAQQNQLNQNFGSFQPLVLGQFRAQFAGQPHTWRNEVSAAERFGHISTIVSALKLLKPDHPAPQQLAFWNLAIDREKTCLFTAPDKNQYNANVKQVLQALHAQRQQMAQRQPLGPGQMQMPNGMMQAMPGQHLQGQTAPNGQPIPQAFNPQLRGPMQASPIPMTAQSSAMGTPMHGAVAPGMQQQLSNQPQPHQTPQVQNQQPVQRVFPPELVQKIALSIRQQRPAPPGAVAQLWASLPADKQLSIRSQNMDPEHFYFTIEARKYLTAQAAQQQQQQQQQAGRPVQFGQQNMPQAMLNTQQLEMNFMNQQQEALNSANAGQPVVPPSNNPPLGSLGIGQGFAGGLPPGQLTPGGMMRQNMPNAHAQAHQMQAHVQQAQQAQKLAQIQQNRQAMMGGAMSSQPGMPLLPAGAGPQQPGFPRQQPMPTAGMGIQRPGMTPEMAAVIQSREARIPAGVPPQVRQALLSIPDEQHFLGQLQKFLQSPQYRSLQAATMGPGAGSTPVNGMLQQNMQRPQPGQQVPLPTGVMGPGQMPQPGIQRAQQIPQDLMNLMDARDFPPVFISANNFPQPPPNVKKWGELKSWIAANRPSIPADFSFQKLLMAQVASYKRDMLAHNNQINNAANHEFQQQVMQQAPSTQPTPNAAMPPQFNFNVTPQEMLNFRQRFPQAAGKSDEELRQVLINMKMKQAHAAANPQAARMTAQVSQATQAARPMPVSQVPQPMEQGQIQQNRFVAQAGKNAQPAQRAPPNKASPQAQAQKMLKRPSNDGDGDVQEKPMQTPQAQPMVNTASQQPAAGSQGSGNALGRNQTNIAEIRIMFLQFLNEARVKYNNNVQGGVMTTEKHAQYQAILNKFHDKLAKVDGSMMGYFIATKNQEEIRNLFNDRFFLGTQIDFSNKQQIKLKNGIFVELEEFRRLIGKLTTFVTQWEMKQQTQPQQTQVQGQNQVQAKPQSTPKLGQVSQSPKQPATQSTAQGQRRASTKAPPAPTVGPGQGAFQFPSSVPTGVQSPSGAPMYFEGAKLIDPKMPQPPFKKQKRASTAASPSSNSAASPQMTKTPVTTKAQPPTPINSQQVEQPKPKPFKCDQSNCEYIVKGFDTQAQLDNHKSMVHVPFPEDPLAFAIESVSNAMHVEEFAKQIGTKDVKGTPTASTPASQTMARSTTQPGTKTSPSFSLLKGGKEVKPPGPTSAPKAIKEPESLEKEEDLWANTLFSPTNLQSFFDIDAFREPNIASVPSTLDSSPSALTPSSSRESASSSTREKSSDIHQDDNLKVTVNMDATSLNFGDLIKDTVIFSIDDIAEIQNGDFSDMGIFPSTVLDGDDLWAGDSSKPSFSDPWMTGETDDKVIDFGQWDVSGSTDEFDQMMF